MYKNSPAQLQEKKMMLVVLATLLAWLTLTNSFVMDMIRGPALGAMDRRDAVVAGSTTFALGGVRAHATVYYGACVNT